jgi:integrase
MTRQRNKLSAKQVAAIIKAAKPLQRYGDGGGLELQISTWGTASWRFRFMLDGKARFMGLGSALDFTLAEARERAAAARKLVADKIDPIAAKLDAASERKIEAARTMTFRECAEAFLLAPKIAGFKSETHRKQWRSTLEKAYPALGSIPVAKIDTPLVLSVLRPIWAKTPETASRLRGRMERVIAWATVQGYRTGDNPCRWRGHLADMFPARPKVKHHEALPYAMLPDFMLELRGKNEIGARALEFTILTAARTSETILATWDEIDLRAKVWTRPADHMKTGKEHRVPLSDRAVEILRELPRMAEHIFPGKQGGLSNAAMAKQLKGLQNGYTVHGFRSTFSDWARDCTAYPRDEIEMALAHVIKDKTEAAYRRGDALDKRTKLMQLWADHCDGAFGAGDNVVPLRSA